MPKGRRKRKSIAGSNPLPVTQWQGEVAVGMKLRCPARFWNRPHENWARQTYGEEWKTTYMEGIITKHNPPCRELIEQWMFRCYDDNKMYSFNRKWMETFLREGCLTDTHGVVVDTDINGLYTHTSTNSGSSSRRPYQAGGRGSARGLSGLRRDRWGRPIGRGRTTRGRSFQLIHP